MERSVRASLIDTLLLTARHAPDGSVADWSVFNMAQAENRLYNISHIRHVVAACSILEACMWRAHLGRKPQRLVDRECGEMNVILGAISDVATVVLGNIFWTERVIVHFTLHEMVFCALIGKGFQQRAAPRARASQDNWEPS